MYIWVHYLNILMYVTIFLACICITIIQELFQIFFVSEAFMVLLVNENHLLSSVFFLSLKVVVGKKCDKENDC